MLTEICQYLRNWFEISKSFGWHSIVNGEIVGENLLDGQYFRIVGSALNDGVYQYGVDKLKDETFHGAVWAMAVPPAVATLAKDISDWVATNATAINSPYQSESFGGYSYSLRGGSDAGGLTWESQFAARLAPWRKI